jgi:hypothetical protein
VEGADGRISWDKGWVKDKHLIGIVSVDGGHLGRYEKCMAFGGF